MLDYDQLAADYARHRAINTAVLKSLINASNLGATSCVLEVGCGTGNYIGAIQQAIGAHCRGTEPSTNMLATASERYLELTIELGSAEAIPFADDVCDLVYTVDVIHHVGDHAAYFREARRVLKPGGLICTVTDSEDVIRRRRPLSNYFPETIAVDLGRYSAIGHLADLMDDAGFTDIETSDVEFEYLLDDIQAYEDKAFSCLQLISHDAFDRGFARMQTDQSHDPISALSLYSLLWGRRPIA